jgi:ethanolamine permease
MAIGIITLVLFQDQTGQIITISVFGALTLYIISMIALLRLRKKEPGLERPFKVPLYPWFPLTALSIAIFSFVAMVIYNPALALIYLAILICAFGCFKFFKMKAAK